MSVIPNLNFQPYNPADTAIQTALAIYGTGLEGQSKRTQNELNRAKQPYVSQQEQALLDERILANELSKYSLQNAPKLNEANLALIGAQTENQLQQAAKMRNVLQMIQEFMDEGKSTGAYSGQQMSPVAASYPGPSAQEVYKRRFVGVPDVTPQEESAIKLWEGYQQKNMETQFPTSTTLTNQQRLTKITPALAKGMYEILDDYDKSLTSQISLFGTKAPTAFNKKIENAGEPFAIAKNFGTDAGGLHKAESIISPAFGESKEEYARRLYGQLEDVIPAVQSAYALENKQIPEEFKNYFEKIRQAAYPEKGAKKGKYSLTDPKVLHTAKKYGMTPEEVIRKLEEGK